MNSSRVHATCTEKRHQNIFGAGLDERAR